MTIDAFSRATTIQVIHSVDIQANILLTDMKRMRLPKTQENDHNVQLIPNDRCRDK